MLRSPWLTQGYVDNPEASEALWAGGYLHTGDIAVITPDGYIRITDQMKDVIKSGGEWVSSEQIEDLIEQYPGVKEAAVIGIPDKKWGERPLALVVEDTGHASRLRETDIKAHLRGIRYPRPHLEIRNSRDYSIRRSLSQNERRQDRQEGSA